MSRSVFALLALVVLAFAQAEGAKEAQALFEAMEAKLLKGTCKVSVESVMTQGDALQVTVAARIELGAGNRMRMVMDYRKPDGSELLRATIRSNGVHVALARSSPQGDQEREFPVSTRFGRDFRLALSRATAFVALDAFKTDSEDELVSATGFKLGPKESEGDRSLQVIEYTIQTRKDESLAEVKLWIDTSTGLPAKRTIQEAEKPDTLSETYSGFELGVTFPEGTFDLPEGEGDKPDAPTSRPAEPENR